DSVVGAHAALAVVHGHDVPVEVGIAARGRHGYAQGASGGGRRIVVTGRGRESQSEAEAPRCRRNAHGYTSRRQARPVRSIAAQFARAPSQVIPYLLRSVV